MGCKDSYEVVQGVEGPLCEEVEELGVFSFFTNRKGVNARETHY